MKSEKPPVSLAQAVATCAAVDRQTRPPGVAAKPLPRKRQRLPQQDALNPPEGATPELKGAPLGFGRSMVPVSVVAREWGISARRVRVMLVEGRLDGRQKDNGYWEVFYPYRYLFGTRGPAIKRQRNLPPAPPKPQKLPRYPEW